MKCGDYNVLITWFISYQNSLFFHLVKFRQKNICVKLFPDGPIIERMSWSCGLFLTEIHRQLKASFRLSNLWLQGFVTSKLYMYFSFLYLYCHYKLLCITTSYLLYILLLHFLMLKVNNLIIFQFQTSIFTHCERKNFPLVKKIIERK